MIARITTLGLAFWGFSLINVSAQESFVLHDRDRVVFVGDGFIERAQRYGYIETALSTHWPNQKITFRNVGWSGDTVEGEARDHYTNPPTAYQHLIEQVTKPNPTVLFIGYGSHLAFENDDGFEAFVRGYHALLDDLLVAEKKCVLMSPIPHEEEKSPFPNVKKLNGRLEQAANLINEIATNRDCFFVDLFTDFATTKELPDYALTTNGIHLTEEGYKIAAGFIINALSKDSYEVTINVDDGKIDGADIVTSNVQGNRYEYRIIPRHLAVSKSRKLTIKGLRKGEFRVSTNSGVLGTGKRSYWEGGVWVEFGEEQEQVADLRTEIVEKNELYFRQYRPQNETYLVGFRKYEQGQNAIELELLTPLIYEKENAIGRLKIPQPITITIQAL